MELQHVLQEVAVAFPPVTLELVGLPFCWDKIEAEVVTASCPRLRVDLLDPLPLVKGSQRAWFLRGKPGLMLEARLRGELSADQSRTATAAVYEALGYNDLSLEAYAKVLEKLLAEVPPWDGETFWLLREERTEPLLVASGRIEKPVSITVSEAYPQLRLAPHERRENGTAALTAKGWLVRFPDIGRRLCGWLCKLPAGKRLEAEAMLARGGRVPEVADELGVLPEQVQRVADAMRKRESRKWRGKNK